MAFDTPNGRRGARQPKANAFVRWGNRLVARRIRKRGGRGVMGMNVLILTTIGAKSGEERSTPVAWFPGGEGSWLVSATAAGAAKHPAWYRNLAAHPDRVRIEVDGQSVDVVAEQLHGDDRATAWEQIVAAAPRFAGYETATDREIPVIRLRRRDG